MLSVSFNRLAPGWLSPCSLSSSRPLPSGLIRYGCGDHGAWRLVCPGAAGWRRFCSRVIAALRPSVVFQLKKKQPASILFLLDDSSSMKIGDEISGQRRWDFAKKTLDRVPRGEQGPRGRSFRQVLPFRLDPPGRRLKATWRNPRAIHRARAVDSWKASTARPGCTSRRCSSSPTGTIMMASPP